MDAARAAPGHGWPMAAGPRSVAGVKVPRRSRGQTGSLTLGCLLKKRGGSFQVTRRRRNSLAVRTNQTISVTLNSGNAHPTSELAREFSVRVAMMRRIYRPIREQARSHRDVCSKRKTIAYDLCSFCRAMRSSCLAPTFKRRLMPVFLGFGGVIPCCNSQSFQRIRSSLTTQPS